MWPKADSSDFAFIVDEIHSGERLDTYVSSRLVDVSRSYAADLIKKNFIFVQGENKKPGYKLKIGESVSGRIPPPEPASYGPEALPLEVVFEDEHMIVINKQPGIVVHPAPGHYTGTIVNALLHRCPDLEGIGGEMRPGIVHRLDKDTSGLMVVAKTAFTQERLSAQFKQRTVVKRYQAVIVGNPKIDGGRIDFPVGRHRFHRQKMWCKEGRTALTLWRVIERLEGAAWVEAHIKTGRTHQIRVHFAEIGFPVVGDAIYGGSSRHRSEIIRNAPRQMLHARFLQLTHPVEGKEMHFEAPIPEDMERLISRLSYA